MSFLKNRYKSGVLVGNWVEDACLRRSDIETYKDAQRRGDTVLQKLEILTSNFLAPIELSTDPFVRYGSIVQLVPSRMRTNKSCGGYKAVCSIAPDNNDVIKNQDITENGEITIAPNKDPVTRNSFVITSPDRKCRTNEILRYGQNFMLQNMGSTAPFLLCSPNSENLRNVIPPYKCFIQECAKLPVGLFFRQNIGQLTDYPTAHAYWKCYSLRNDIRLETEGDPVPANTELVIVHSVTNKKLTAENVEIITIFGKECLITVSNCNVMDSCKPESWRNVWMFSNNANAEDGH